MTIEQLGSIGEIIGAIATVATLGYLAIQIRQSSRVALAQAEREINNLGVTLAVSQDPDLARLYRAGCADFAGLSADEQVRFSFLMSNLFSNYQSHLACHDKGLLPEERRNTTIGTIRFMVRQPGVRTWWEASKFHFAPTFVAEVDHLLEAPDPSGQSAA